jgi:nitrogen fixation NifU-like protein
MKIHCGQMVEGALKAALDAESASPAPITPTQNTAPTLSDSLPSAHAPGKVKIVFTS